MGINLFELLVSLFMVILIVSMSGTTTAHLLQRLSDVQGELLLPHDSPSSPSSCKRVPLLSDVILDCTNSDKQVTSYLISQ